MENVWLHFGHRCLHTDDELFLKSMREAIHEILTDVSDSFSNMIDMALANEIRVTDLFSIFVFPLLMRVPV